MTKFCEQKEEIYNEMKRIELPYTVIDVGYWYQISFPPVPSGKVDYAILKPETTIHGDGNAPNILTDLRDIGRFVARIISDERTLNKYVYTCGDVLTENEIFTIVEELSGEKIQRVFVGVSIPSQHINVAYNWLSGNNAAN
jgi:nucleoside-diphosphate-sugar epimerase